jgi:hypothetical protein
MESSGHYYWPLASHLHRRGYGVAVVNPLQVKYVAKSRLQRSKSHPADARTLAVLGMSEEPRVKDPLLGAEAKEAALVSPNSRSASKTPSARPRWQSSVRRRRRERLPASESQRRFTSQLQTLREMTCLPEFSSVFSPCYESGSHASYVPRARQIRHIWNIHRFWLRLRLAIVRLLKPRLPSTSMPSPRLLDSLATEESIAM